MLTNLLIVILQRFCGATYALRIVCYSTEPCNLVWRKPQRTPPAPFPSPFYARHSFTLLFSPPWQWRTGPLHRHGFKALSLMAFPPFAPSPHSKFQELRQAGRKEEGRQCASRFSMTRLLISSVLLVYHSFPISQLLGGVGAQIVFRAYNNPPPTRLLEKGDRVNIG